MKKLLTKLAILLFAVTLSTSLMAQTYSGGSGTSIAPYQIANKTDLRYLSEYSGEWTKHFIQTADITFTAADFESDGDFYNSGNGFIPIGGGSYGSTDFDGLYDGNGFMIENLYINRPSISRIGFFGRISDTGDLDDINLVNVDITGGGQTAALVGQPYGAINDCRSSGSVSGTSTVGGLVGQVNSGSSIANCYSTATVNSSGSEAGGFAASSYASISRCYSTGNVSGTSVVGGFIGNTKNTIQECFSTGNVSGTSSVGGLIGKLDFSWVDIDITNCYSLGNVTRTSGTSTSFGAFSGESYSNPMSGSRECTIENCYSTGNVYESVGVSWSSLNKGFVGEETESKGVVSGTYTYTNNFWDSESSNQSTATGATAKTTTQMKTQSTFTNWDFIGETTNGTNDYWSIDGTTNSGYPFLSWEAQCWIGTAKSTDWFIASNWHSGVLPSSTDNVSIANTSTEPTISGATTAECNNLVVASGSILTIDYNGKLTVGNDLTNSSTFTINSTSLGTGSLIVEGTATGSVTFQRSITTWTNSTDGWHLLSSPVTMQAIRSNFVPDPPTANEDFYSWKEDETTNNWINTKSGTATWNSGFENDFTVGKGYLVAYGSSSVVSHEFSGVPNVANVSKSSLTYTTESPNTGWHLLGNPYSSALYWNKTSWGLTNVFATAKIWKESSAAYIDVAASSGIIPAMQGFMVRVTSSSGSLIIKAGDRTHNSQNWYKGTEANIIKLTGYDTENGTAQESIIKFDPLSTENIDIEFDSYFMSGYAPLFYTMAKGKALSTNTLPELKEELNIPLYFTKNTSSTFYIEAEGIENLIPDYHVYLTDLKTNNTQNLTNNPVYSFTSEEGDDVQRFLLHFKSVGIEEPETELSKIQIWASNKTINILNPEHQKGTIRIINIYGQKLIETQLTGNEHQEVIVNVSAGNYIVNVVGNNKVASKKIFIK